VRRPELDGLSWLKKINRKKWYEDIVVVEVGLIEVRFGSPGAHFIDAQIDTPD
jgi:hypothetical protein